MTDVAASRGGVVDAARERAPAADRASGGSRPERTAIALAAGPPLLAAVLGVLLLVAVDGGDAESGAAAWAPALLVAGSVFVAAAAGLTARVLVRRHMAALGDVTSGLLAIAAGARPPGPFPRSSDAAKELVDSYNAVAAASARGHDDADESGRARLLEKLIDAQEEERKRIARELHDGVGQALLSMLVGLKIIGRAEDVDAAHAKAEDMRSVVAETLEQVRTMSRELRPSVLDDLGLAVALDRYAAEFPGRYPGVTVDVHCDLSERLPSALETALYRITQEAMTNAARHGGCGTIGVLLSKRDGRVQAIIEDDGSGFDVAATRRAGSSVGIHGMLERAELVGGQLEIESGSDGTTVYVEIPL